MTKEELGKEIEEKGIEYADSLKYTISKFSDEEGYCWSQVEEAYEKGALDFAEPREKRIAELEAQIKKMKSDVTKNIKWADQNKNNQMYCKLNAMLNQWGDKRK